MTKSAAQLDAEIAAALRGPRTVEGLHIPVDSRRELNRFWRAHPSLRKGCLRKYGFDPIDEETNYWRYGMAEPDHRSTLRAIRQNDDVFSLALVKRWEAQELEHTRSTARKKR